MFLGFIRGPILNERLFNHIGSYVQPARLCDHLLKVTGFVPVAMILQYFLNQVRETFLRQFLYFYEFTYAVINNPCGG